MNNTRKPHRIIDFLISQLKECQVIRQEEYTLHYSKYWVLGKLIKWVSALGLAYLGLILTSCAHVTPKVVVEYQTIEIPISCIVDYPVKPTPANNPIELTLQVLEYVEKLESALSACKLK